MDNLEPAAFANFREGGLFFCFSPGAGDAGPISQTEFMAKLLAERASCQPMLQKMR